MTPFRQVEVPRWGVFNVGAFALLTALNLALGPSVHAALPAAGVAVMSYVLVRDRLLVSLQAGVVEVRRGWGRRAAVPLAGVSGARIRRWGEGAAVGPWSLPGYDVVELTLADGATLQIGTTRARELAAALGVALGPEDMLPRRPPWTDAQVRRSTAAFVAGMGAMVAFVSWWVLRDLG